MAACGSWRVGQAEYDRELGRVTAEVKRLDAQGATGQGSYKAMEQQMVCRAAGGDVRGLAAV